MYFVHDLVCLLCLTKSYSRWHLILKSHESWVAAVSQIFRLWKSFTWHLASLSVFQQNKLLPVLSTSLSLRNIQLISKTIQEVRVRVRVWSNARWVVQFVLSMETGPGIMQHYMGAPWQLLSILKGIHNHYLSISAGRNKQTTKKPEKEWQSIVV